VAVILLRSLGLSWKHMKIVRDLRLDTGTFI
jgi:ribosomal protein L30/L7E